MKKIWRQNVFYDTFTADNGAGVKNIFPRAWKLKKLLEKKLEAVRE